MTINHDNKNYVIINSPNAIQIQLTINKTGCFYDNEIHLQSILNEVGAAATGEILKEFDTDGEKIVEGNRTFYSKGLFPEEYKTPYGPTTVMRQVYQCSDGGKTFVPLEKTVGMILNSTPMLARQVSSKAVEMSFGGVKRDLAENHGNPLCIDYIQSITQKIGEHAQNKEAHWHFNLPFKVKINDVKTISSGLDGTNMYLKDGGGWRETMCGTITLLDADGNRLHTIYVGHSPEYGKQSFLDKMDRELNEVRKLFPHACVQGLADGAVVNWAWLNERTDYQVLDFYHLSEHVGKAGEAIFGDKQAEKEKWLKEWLHRIKHTNRGVYHLIEYLEEVKIKVKGKNLELLEKEITYLENQKERTQYQRELQNNRPIGSGVTESACKNLVKARMCKPGMRWKKEGAAAILALRAIFLTAERWDQFWRKIIRYPIPR
jgi:hypothetical protein